MPIPLRPPIRKPTHMRVSGNFNEITSTSDRCGDRNAARVRGWFCGRHQLVSVRCLLPHIHLQQYTFAGARANICVLLPPAHTHTNVNTSGGVHCASRRHERLGPIRVVFVEIALAANDVSSQLECDFKRRINCSLNSAPSGCVSSSMQMSCVHICA